MISGHIKNLENYCRLCGNSPVGNGKLLKGVFAEELYDVFRINVNDDDQSIHPDYLCNSCRCHLYRQQRNRKSKRKKARITPNFQPKIYVEHSDMCKIGMQQKQSEHEKPTKVEEIVGTFSILEHNEKVECLSKLIESLYSETSMKTEVMKIQKKYAYNDLAVLENLDLWEYLQQFDEILVASL